LIGKFIISLVRVSAFVGVGLILIGSSFAIEREIASEFHGAEPDSISKQTSPSDSITIAAVGDIMLGTNYPDNSFLPPNDARENLKNVSPFLKDGTITFGNLEGVFLTSNGTPKTCTDTANCYTFKMPDNYVTRFVEAGFNLLNLANNHTGDFGYEGQHNTIRVLKRAGIHFAGIGAHKFVVFEKQGVKFGFVGFGPNKGELYFNNYESAASIVSKLRSECDIVIVSMHIGAEGSGREHITRNDEEFIEENRGNPYRFARAVIDAGADVVLGHGPHVPRAVDIYKNRFIVYSMGNFATYAKFNIKGISGIAPIFKITMNKKGEFLAARVLSIKQVGRGVPVIDESGRAFKEIERLTKYDIPEAELQFQDQNMIFPR
jgi:hypothetical protein